uniref:Uncharacterized protein n=1 Tax=Clastoptera arizonana TaxID=38151 RepID=A0A1B6DBN5_9HEMI
MFLLKLCLFVVCSLEVRAINIDDLSKERSDDELKSEMTAICENIARYDESITQMLKDPPEDQATIFLKNMYSYNDELIECLKIVTVHRNRAIKHCAEVFEKGGPDFIDVLVDEDVLKDRFKWHDDDVKHLYEIRRETYKFWDKLLRLESGEDCKINLKIMG